MTNPLEEYLESWVFIYHNQDRISGYLKRIEESILFINPFQSFKPAKGGLEYFLKEDFRGYAIPMLNIRIEPTTKEEIEKNIYEMNRYSSKIKELKDFEFIKELKGLKGKKK